MSLLIYTICKHKLFLRLSFRPHKKKILGGHSALSKCLAEKLGEGRVPFGRLPQNPTHLSYSDRLLIDLPLAKIFAIECDQPFLVVHHCLDMNWAAPELLEVAKRVARIVHLQIHAFVAMAQV
jgi:hypothetical protein